MKLIIRILALAVVIAGGVAAAATSKTAPALPNHQSATATMPIPACGPNMPCPIDSSGN